MKAILITGDEREVVILDIKEWIPNIYVPELQGTELMARYPDVVSNHPTFPKLTFELIHKRPNGDCIYRRKNEKLPIR